jgi:hypothetical protein
MREMFESWGVTNDTSFPFPLLPLVAAPFAPSDRLVLDGPGPPPFSSSVAVLPLVPGPDVAA